MSVVNFPFYGNAIYGAFINLPTGVPDGTLAVTLDTYSLWVYNAGTSTWAGVNDQPSSPILLPNGSAALPSMAFANSPATGLYRVAANSVGFSANGTICGIYGAAGNWAFGSGAGVNANVMMLVTGSNIAGATNGYGLFSDLTVPAVMTAGVEVVASRGTTVASAFTCSYVIGYNALAHAAGAGSTITRAVGLYTAAQTAGGTGNAHICDNTAFSSSWYINSTSALPSLFSGIVNLSAGFKTKVSTANTSNPPTNAEVISAFGTAAAVGAGFIALMDDNNGHAAEYLIWSDGTKFWQVTGTACA